MCVIRVFFSGYCLIVIMCGGNTSVGKEYILISVCGERKFFKGEVSVFSLISGVRRGFECSVGSFIVDVYFIERI